MSVVAPEFLYHGTIVVFKRAEVEKGRGYRDFGKGFYMSENPRQAIGMMHKKFAEAMSLVRSGKVAHPQEILYRISLDQSVVNGLKTKVFATADAEWLNFVLSCRQFERAIHGYDLVIGPTADDDTRLLIKNYLDGVYGDIGDPEARTTLLRLLKPERLGIQWYVGSQSVLDRLIVRLEPVDWRDIP